MIAKEQYKNICEICVIDKKELENFNEKSIAVPTAVYCTTGSVQETLEEIKKIYSLTLSSKHGFVSPSGYTRARIDISYSECSFTLAEMQRMYDRGINSIRVHRRHKPVLWSQEVLSAKDLEGFPIRFLNRWAAFKWLLDNPTIASWEYLRKSGLVLPYYHGRFYFRMELTHRKLPKLSVPCRA